MIATDITIARSHSDIVCGIVPSAAGDLTIEGRVLDRNGRALSRVYVTGTDSKGKVTTVMTNSFGNFRITGITAGDTYVITPTARGYTFKTEVLWVNDSITGLDFRPSD